METGTFVYDPRTGKVGEFRGKAGPYVMLRPVGGGREWEADPGLIRPATQEERVAAGVRAANARSWTGRRLFRYAPYVIAQDPTAHPEYEARCVSGDESGCGATSGPHPAPDQVEEWQRRHTQETRHLRYRRTFADYAVLERLSAGATTTGSTGGGPGPSPR
ncbi:DUF7848 domain-containing protein [Streptomyces brasiliensis]|uniref:DUF7848 domain-containing protein n=1 Tax=Streptomyces brasiliensis TaxID=1954 RepID=A0A917LE83_9ACTN|nr:hypothetical protein [Streptomyces brasiliensis]GGJ57253.1 hypothetical protein GCM10010121_079880 [Streptomyces brasiliensis]